MKNGNNIITLSSYVGILIGGISVFNLVRKGFQIGLKPVIFDLVNSYEWLFHDVFFSFALGWLIVAAPEFVKDLFSIWIVGFTITIRIMRDLIFELKRQYLKESPPYVISFIIRMSGLQRLVGLANLDVKGILEKIQQGKRLKRLTARRIAERLSVIIYYVFSLFSWLLTYKKLLAGDYQLAKNFFRKKISSQSKIADSNQYESSDEAGVRFPFKKKTEVGDLITTKHTASIFAVVIILLLANAGLPPSSR